MEPRTPEDPRQLANDLADFLRPVVARIGALRTLSSGKVGVLRHLSVHERASGAELAEAIGVSAQAISLATKELQELNCIDREPDASDRRRTWFVLTDQGRERLAAESVASRGWLAAVIDERLTAAERAELAAVMPLLNRLVADQ